LGDILLKARAKKTNTNSNATKYSSNIEINYIGNSINANNKPIKIHID
jgi:hypothetical protein